MLVTLAFACSAPAASATTYCVGAAPSCTGTSEPDLDHALADADADTSGTDAIFLPTGTQTSPSGYIYSGKVPLVISGQGAGTVLTVATGSAVAPVFHDAGTESAIVLRQLEVSLPSSETAGGISLTATAGVSGVAVTGAPGSEGYGIALGGGGQVNGVAISIPPGNDGNPDIGVQFMGSGPSTITGSLISDRTGIQNLGPGSLTVHRCAIAASNIGGAGIYAGGSSVMADDSQIVATQQATGLEAIGTAGGGATITAAQLTIAGDSTATGVHVQGAFGGNALVDLTDSIIADPLASSFDVIPSPGQTTTATTDYDDFDQKSVTGGGTVIIGPHDTKESASAPSGFVNPGFASVSKNNYRLGPSSPLLNYDPTPIGGTPVGSGESTTDLAGEPRITGTGRDLGAYQHQPPTVTASANPTRTLPRTSISFSASGQIVFKNDPLHYNWHFDDGANASGQNVTHAFTTGGSHAATVTVSDALGFTGTAKVTITITGTPVISHATQSASRWRLGKALAHVARKRRKPPVGTTFRFRLSEDARVTFTFAGRKGRHAYTAHLTFEGHRGTNTLRFDGRISSHFKLKPTAWKVVITATRYGLTSSPKTLRFRIVA